MYEVECPYCKEDFNLNNDDGQYYDESGLNEATCPNCDKICMISGSMSWSFDAQPADCLNDGEHDWCEFFTSRDGRWESCRGCGKEREIEKVEKQ